MGDVTEPFDHHGASPPRGSTRAARSLVDGARFGRMFPALPAFSPPDEMLADLAASMTGPSLDNPEIPSGYTYVGQFVDHDITFDPMSALERSNDPDALHNFRTPRFDLDSLYGSGPDDSPFLYDQEDVDKLLVGRNTANIHEPEDLPRNQQGRAIIGDPRNDVHVIVSQMHLALIHFHNAVVDHLRGQFTPEEEVFDEARRLARWHYQWMVVHDYVPRLVGAELVEALLSDGAGPRFFNTNGEPFIPVEFSGAAYRFGHSLVRDSYDLNDKLETLPVFPEALVPNPIQHLGGFRPLPIRWKIDWAKFFPIDGSSPQPSRAIDTNLDAPLHKLPVTVDHDRRSLALLNLLRGKALGLPSGQAVAAAMGTTVPDDDLGLDGETPLWFYVLREAEVSAGGSRLGATGGRIVAEVLLGLLTADPSSFLRMAPDWRPTLPAEQDGLFTMTDLLRFAQVV